MKWLILPLCIVLAGCATYKNYSISSNEPARDGLVVRPPVLVSVFDGRGNREGGANPAADLQRVIAATYPNAVQKTDYFSSTPAGRVGVRIRVLELGSQFGNRIISGVTIANQFGTASARATDGWNTVVATAQSRQSLLGTSMAAEGWWVGSASLLIEVQDRRFGRNISFEIPVAAEQKEYNMWGYATAQASTKRAWEKASSQMFAILDSIVMKTRDGAR